MKAETAPQRGDCANRPWQAQPKPTEQLDSDDSGGVPHWMQHRLPRERRPTGCQRVQHTPDFQCFPHDCRGAPRET